MNDWILSVYEAPNLEKPPFWAKTSIFCPAKLSEMVTLRILKEEFFRIGNRIGRVGGFCEDVF